MLLLSIICVLLLEKGVVGLRLVLLDGEVGGVTLMSTPAEKRSRISRAFLYVSFSFTSSSYIFIQCLYDITYIK
jgi:hypothetical protein